MIYTSNSLLETLITKEVSSILESFRGFDLEKLKRLEYPREMTEYARKYLPRLGAGSSREVFGWKAGKVIKIVHSHHNTFQNKEEIGVYVNNPNLRPYLAKIFDFDQQNYYWIIAEGVQVIIDNAHLRNKFTLPEQILTQFMLRMRKNNLPFEEVLEEALESYNESYADFYVKGPKSVSKEDLNSLDLELYKKFFDLTRMGIDDIDRYDHWGMTTSGRIVVVDYGLTNE